MSGRGTSGGVVFQAEAGALAAGLMLAERPLSRLSSGLPGTPVKIYFETPDAVDDVLVETSMGAVYIQAKRTLNLSASEESELASVADQFVRQFRAGVTEAGIKRPFEPARDRLMLVVGEDSPKTVTSNLRELLDRSRTGAATALPRELANTLDVFAAHIDAAWVQHGRSSITPEERQALLAVSCVVVLGDSERQIVEEALRDIVSNPGDETSLLDLLIAWGASASADGTGGDVSTIRAALSGKISLKELPSYREDVSRLKQYSADVLEKLRRFTEIQSPEGPISITRPISSLVANAARDGSLAITGEPGAGKSAVLYEATRQLCESSTVVVLTVEATALSLDALRAEIALQHSIIEVLKQIPGERPAYLILDALDAVRGGVAEATYKKLVDCVCELPGWHVIASVRTFDLRLGREWRRLFAGRPPAPDYADDAFQAVRHLHVGLFSESEKDELAEKSPSLVDAINAAGPRMESLARNPFNLALLGDLLRGGLAANSLSQVATRGELLDHYWDERISEFGLPATIALKGLVTQMLQAHAIDLPETDIPDTAAASIDDLQAAGVLVTEHTRRIGFRHHVLCDYAIARLLLLPDRTNAQSFLGRSEGTGLLVIPALGYWLEALKKQLGPDVFWMFFVDLTGSDETDPLVRVEVARLCVESVKIGEDLAPLTDALKQSNSTADSAFSHIVGSLVIRSQQRLPILTDEWAHLIKLLGPPPSQRLGSYRTFIGIVMDNNPSHTALTDIGVASRMLFDAMSAEEQRIFWLAPSVVPYVASTFGTNPPASRICLEKLFAPERFSRTGYVEIPWLAQENLKIAAHDENLLIQLYDRAFRAGEFSRDQETSMSSSWILALKSNASQDFKMSTYYLKEDYPELIKKFPTLGLRAFGAALRAVRESEHPATEEPTIHQIPIGDTIRDLEEDHSHIWAWSIDEDRHDDYADLYRATLAWANETEDDAVLLRLPNLILSETRIAVAWRAVLDIAACRPELLGLKLWRNAGSSSLLHPLETRRAAIDVIAATYPLLPRTERIDAEIDWLARDFSDFTNPDSARVTILGTLFETIGDTHLVTDEALSFLREARADNQSLENRRPFEVHMDRMPDRHWLEREGIDTTSGDVAPLVELSKSVHQARDGLKDDLSAEKGRVLWNATSALEQALAGASEVNPLVDQEASDALADGLGTALFQEFVPEVSTNATIEKLLELSHHSDPLPLSEENEQKFKNFPSWGSPSPRIMAARQIARLATKPAFWPKVRERFESLLLEDRHPAVRLQLLAALPWLERIDEDAMWALSENVLTRESNGAILKSAVGKLYYLHNLHAARLEPLILPLVKADLPDNGDDPVTGLVVCFAIEHNLPDSNAALQAWVDDYVNHERSLKMALSDIRGYLLYGINELDPNKGLIRDRTRAFLRHLIETVTPAVRSLPLSSQEPSSKEISALKLFDAIADQIFYAVGHSKISPNVASEAAKQKFLDEYEAIISELSTLGTPNAVYHLLSVLDKMTDADPERCFDLFSEAVLRTTGVARYEYESLGVKLFVNLVGRYLADFRFIFEDPARRSKVIDCIALFVEAGWPEARRLFQNLPELLQ